MQWHKNVECKDAGWLKAHWTEEVKFNESYNDYKDEFFDMFPELEVCEPATLVKSMLSNNGSSLPCLTLDLYTLHLPNWTACLRV